MEDGMVITAEMDDDTLGMLRLRVKKLEQLKITP